MRGHVQVVLYTSGLLGRPCISRRSVNVAVPVSVGTLSAARVANPYCVPCRPASAGSGVDEQELVQRAKALAGSGGPLIPSSLQASYSRQCVATSPGCRVLDAAGEDLVHDRWDRCGPNECGRVRCLR